MKPAGKSLDAVLWWAVLLSSHPIHATAAAAAADRRSTDRPYERPAIATNTTVTAKGEGAPLPHPSISLSNALPPVQTGQSASPPHISLNVSLGTGTFAIPATSSTRRSGNAASASSNGGGFRGTIIANITTPAKPPLTIPTTVTDETNLSSLTFPVSPPNLTNNATISKAWFTNSSIIAPLTVTIAPPTATEDLCTSTFFGPFPTIIQYSVVHTWTITWLGDPADYTPPFPTINTPRLCTPVATATGKLEGLMCDGLGLACSAAHTVEKPPSPTPSPTSAPGWLFAPEPSPPSFPSLVKGLGPTVVFVTTDKNPAVVFPTSLPPDYGGSPDPVGSKHSAAFPNQAQSPEPPPAYGEHVTTNQNIRSTPAPTTSLPPVTVIVKPTIVVIDDHTFTNNLTQPTSTVVVDGNTFTIDPTQVVGVGTTVTRPPNSKTTVPPPPTRTTVGDIGVDVEGSSVVIDNTHFTIGTKPTTVVIKDQTITLRPGAIVFPSETLTIPAGNDMTQVVVGAELITAIGSDTVVLEGETLTYGPSSSTVTKVIDGDTVLIGPSGIVAHGETYGGSSAASTNTQFAVVGGVTVSQVGSTAFVIQDITYTLDSLISKQTMMTTVLGGETVTIGPEGVTIDTWTLNSAYASTVTITPSNSAAMAEPTAATDNTNKENNAPSSAYRRPAWALTACIATFFGILGAWSF
ncbi:hypothetical protein F4777DRAFT_476811 [Nemania sp. FL0916]|nr:hypothetical protein F4777DRAFT_476811 [Nemania sp. FL0916]